MKTILALFAHPDDEAFGAGGTLAKYADEGAQITLVCATRGERGEISDPNLATPETLSYVREDELRCAAEKLGIEELIFLNYKDSGMEGTPENEDPEAFIQAAEEEVIEKLVAIIRRIRPQIMITFEPNGGYGHPDHIAIHNHTLSAFQIAGEAAELTHLGRPWKAERLYYTALPRSVFIEMRERLKEIGEDTQDLEMFEKSGAGWPDDMIDVQIDVSEKVENKWSALICHRTQFGEDNLFRRLPNSVSKSILSTEYFTLAWPHDAQDGMSQDLFFDL